ncbi:MAG: hypothetical protein E7621_01640 [Ruminococcaceae bacterium]|nr:hypothetical protein [Oscillospiraceae bacterium]
MKKTYDYEACCALCEYSCYMELDETYVCKYKNRLSVVEDTSKCRHFKFDLLKIEPHPKKPYSPDGIELESIVEE